MSEPTLSLWILLRRAVRAFLFLCLSLSGALIAAFGAFDGEWTKAIFGLILMVVADNRIDKLYEDQKKQQDELIRDAEIADQIMCQSASSQKKQKIKS